MVAVLVVMTILFAAMVLGFQGIFLMLAFRQEEQETHLRRRLGLRVEEDEVAKEEDNVAQIIREQGVDQAIAFLGEYGERMQTTIRAASSDLTVTKLFTNMVVMGALIAMIMVFLVGTAGVLVFPVGFYLPYMLLQRQASQRASALLSQMPDALENMSRAMQTGNGLSECFRIASEEMPMPINIEFGRIYEEVRFGRDWREVLNGLVERNPTIFDLRLFVSSMLLQRDTGGNMIETLANIAKTIRNRYVFDETVKAKTSEARASGMVLALMPVGVILMIIVASPDYLEPLYTTGLGKIFIMCATVWYFVGIYMMNMLAQVEV
jgi:tight adherence protein B